MGKGVEFPEQYIQGDRERTTSTNHVIFIEYIVTKITLFCLLSH